MSNAQFVPGEFACPECGFVVMKSTMYVGNGVVAPDTKDVLEPCPNDGVILRPVPYATALADARNEAVKHMARSRIGEQMETLLHNLLQRGRLHGHEKTAAENIVKDFQQAR